MVFLCFFLSGACGLVYEVVWIRMMVLTIGSTVFAVSAVVTSFMAGLALGSYVLGKAADRFRGPLLFYAVLEVVVGAYAIFVPEILDRTLAIFRDAHARFALSFYAFSLLRFGVAFVVLLAPTCLMGGTLPVLARYYTQRREQAGSRVGLLYALNTFGAAFGAFAAGFVLLPRFGMSHTVAIAAGTNLALGVLAFGVWLYDLRACRRDPTPAAQTDVQAPPLAAAETRVAETTLVLCAFAVSGFCGMTYEVAWTRVLSLIIGSSVYGVTTILATFLLGIGLGSLLCSGLAAQGRCRPFHLGLLLVFIGLSSFGTMLLFGRLPYWFLACYRRIGESYDLLLLANFALSLVVMLVPTVLLGMTFPVVVGVCARDIRALGTRVGEAYCANTLGAILGSFAAGFVLVPFVGVQYTVLAAIVAHVLLGMALVLRSPQCRRFTKAVLVVGVVACAAAWPQAMPRWNALLMSSGVYHYARALSQVPAQALHALYSGEGDELLYYAEGMSATVCVAEKRTGDRYLRINGKVDASTGDMPTQVLLGHLPLLLKPDARDAFVVGYGSGATVGSALCHPVETLVCAEVESKVVEAGACFDDVNGQPLKDERLEIRINDARNYLLMADRQFDVIVSQPSNPWITGVSNLFTRDFFRIGASSLTDRGVFCQWLQVYCLSLEDLRTLLATFQETFEHVLMFVPGEGDLVLIGSRHPLTLDVARLDAGLRRPSVAKDLARTGVKHLHDLLGRFVLGGDELRAFVQGAPINTDDNALIEFDAPRTMHQPATTDSNLAALRQAGRGALVRYLTHTPERKPDLARLLLGVARSAREQAWAEQALDLAQHSIAASDAVPARRFLASLYADQGQTNEAMAQWRKALELDPDDTAALAELAAALIDLRQLDDADAALQKLLALDASHMRGRYLKGLLLWERGQVEQAGREFRLAQRQSGAAALIPRVYYMIGLVLKREGRLAEAANNMARYLERVPNDVDARLDLGAVYYALGRRADAVEQWQHGVHATHARSGALVKRGRTALAAGQDKLAEECLRAAIDMDRLNLDSYVELGRLLERQGRTGAGIELFEALVQRYPRDGFTHYRLGALYEKAGKKTRAASHLREYLRLETNAQRRARAKERLKALESPRRARTQ